MLCSHPFRLPARAALIAALILVLAPLASAAQTLADPVLPGGHARLSGLGGFTSWSATYGPDFAGAADVPDAALAPGIADLRAALAPFAVGPATSLSLGLSGAQISVSRVQVPISLELGIFDWLTVGAELPLQHSRLESEMNFGADAALGLNPTIDRSSAVIGFLGGLGARASSSALLASERCGAAPASPACLEAQQAADLIGQGYAAFLAAYGSGPFFPVQGTDAAQGLLDWTAAADDRLVALGLPTLGAPPLALSGLDAEALADLRGATGPFQGTAFAPYEGLLAPGDLTVRGAVRLLDVRSGVDSLGVPDLRLSLAATGAVRVPLATPDSLDLYGELGASDGQSDLEAGAWAALSLRRFAVRARGRYAIQNSASFAVPRTATAVFLGLPAVLAEIDPGDEFELEIEPALRLAPALSISGVWRAYRRGAGTVAVSTVGVPATESGPPPIAAGEPVELAFLPTVGATGFGEYTLQEIGGALTYRTVDLGARDGRGFEAFVQVVRSMGGDTGLAPDRMRAVMGLRFVRRLWGS